MKVSWKYLWKFLSFACCLFGFNKLSSIDIFTAHKRSCGEVTLGRHPPPGRQLLALRRQLKRAVNILLECIRVYHHLTFVFRARDMFVILYCFVTILFIVRFYIILIHFIRNLPTSLLITSLASQLYILFADCKFTP